MQLSKSLRLRALAKRPNAV
uniref:Uncharacterized protein n=1 Tax=Anguilla anguilla TaxID=7936 RepID=A0A0E9SUL9_ANGAN